MVNFMKNERLNFVNLSLGLGWVEWLTNFKWGKLYKT